MKQGIEKFSDNQQNIKGLIDYTSSALSIEGTSDIHPFADILIQPLSRLNAALGLSQIKHDQESVMVEKISSKLMETIFELQKPSGYNSYAEQLASNFANEVNNYISSQGFDSKENMLNISKYIKEISDNSSFEISRKMLRYEQFLILSDQKKSNIQILKLLEAIQLSELAYKGVQGRISVKGSDHASFLMQIDGIMSSISTQIVQNGFISQESTIEVNNKIDSLEYPGDISQIRKDNTVGKSRVSMGTGILLSKQKHNAGMLDNAAMDIANTAVSDASKSIDEIASIRDTIGGDLSQEILRLQEIGKQFPEKIKNNELDPQAFNDLIEVLQKSGQKQEAMMLKKHKDTILEVFQNLDKLYSEGKEMLAEISGLPDSDDKKAMLADILMMMTLVQGLSNESINSGQVIAQGAKRAGEASLLVTALKANLPANLGGFAAENLLGAEQFHGIGVLAIILLQIIARIRVMRGRYGIFFRRSSVIQNLFNGRGFNIKEDWSKLFDKEKVSLKIDDFEKAALPDQMDYVMKEFGDFFEGDNQISSELKVLYNRDYKSKNLFYRDVLKVINQQKYPIYVNASTGSIKFLTGLGLISDIWILKGKKAIKGDSILLNGIDSTRFSSLEQIRYALRQSEKIQNGINVIKNNINSNDKTAKINKLNDVAASLKNPNVLRSSKIVDSFITEYGLKLDDDKVTELKTKVQGSLEKFLRTEHHVLNTLQDKLYELEKAKKISNKGDIKKIGIEIVSLCEKFSRGLRRAIRFTLRNTPYIKQHFDSHIKNDKGLNKVIRGAMEDSNKTITEVQKQLDSGSIDDFLKVLKEQTGISTEKYGSTLLEANDLILRNLDISEGDNILQGETNKVMNVLAEGGSKKMKNISAELDSISEYSKILKLETLDSELQDVISRALINAYVGIKQSLLGADEKFNNDTVIVDYKTELPSVKEITIKFSEFDSEIKKEIVSLMKEGLELEQKVKDPIPQIETNMDSIGHINKQYGEIKSVALRGKILASLGDADFSTLSKKISSYVKAGTMTSSGIIQTGVEKKILNGVDSADDIEKFIDKADETRAKLDLMKQKNMDVSSFISQFTDAVEKGSLSDIEAIKANVDLTLQGKINLPNAADTPKILGPDGQPLDVSAEMNKKPKTKKMPISDTKIKSQPEVVKVIPEALMHVSDVLDRMVLLGFDTNEFYGEISRGEVDLFKSNFDEIVKQRFGINVESFMKQVDISKITDNTLRVEIENLMKDGKYDQAFDSARKTGFIDTLKKTFKGGKL